MDFAKAFLSKTYAVIVSTQKIPLPHLIMLPFRSFAFRISAAMILHFLYVRHNKPGILANFFC
jgi:hypothetical protein